MINPFKILTFVGVVGAGALAYHFVQRQIGMVKNICIRIVGGKVKKIRKKSWELILNYEVTNESMIEATVTGYELDAIFDGSKIADISAKVDIPIPKKSKATLPVEIRFNPMDVLRGGALATVDMLLSPQSDYEVRIKGNIKVRGYGLEKQIPVDYVESLRELYKDVTTKKKVSQC